MDGSLRVKNIDYGKVNLHITKSGGDINQPTITTQHYPYMGKKTYYPFPNFRVSHQYKGVSSTYKALQAVLETYKKYLPTYGKSSCVLTYRDLQNLSRQVSTLKDSNNFRVKLNEIYFSYVFLNGRPYQTYADKKGFHSYMSSLTLQHIMQQQHKIYLQNTILLMIGCSKASIVSMLCLRHIKW